VSKQRRSSTICIYCRSRRATTVDHIPPKSFFPRPRPNNLITVPSCDVCNAAFARDDEEFRRMLLFRDDIGSRPEFSALLDSVHRSLVRPQARRIRDGLLADVRDVNLRSPAGLYLGTRAIFHPRLDVADRSGLRMGSAIFFRETGHLLPAESLSRCRVLSALTFSPEGERSLRNIIRYFGTIEPRSVGRGVFQYWFTQLPSPSFGSVCIFRFYERLDLLWLAMQPETPTS
jgi:hypothetical protein